MPEKGEEVNYLASVSDLVTALLFILLLSICFCVTQLNQYKDSASIIRELESELKKAKEQSRKSNKELELVKSQLAEIMQKIAGANIARTNLLEELGNKLKQEGIDVQIDPATGVLRLPENAITFETGRSELRQKYKERLKKLGQALSKELPCYDASQWNSFSCGETNPLAYTLDAVFVEGHTDNQPFGGDTTGTRNRSLSTERANTVFSELRKDNPSLFELKNPRGQLLFSLSGYGEERPLEGHKHAQPKSDEANRRIEIRFLMTTPELSESEYEKLKKKIEAADTI